MNDERATAEPFSLRHSAFDICYSLFRASVEQSNPPQAEMMNDEVSEGSGLQRSKFSIRYSIFALRNELDS